MDNKTQGWIKIFLPMFCSIILSTGLIIAAIMIGNVMADRPMRGDFDGTLSLRDYSYPDIMGIDELMRYLDIRLEDYEDYDDYEKAQNKLRSELKNDIVGGNWTGFPYVKIKDRLYFNKEAVDDWFREQGKQQLTIG